MRVYQYNSGSGQWSVMGRDLLTEQLQVIMLVRALLLVAMDLVLLWELHLVTVPPPTRTGDFHQQRAVC